MQHMTLNTAHKNFGGLFEDVVNGGEPISIASDKGAVIVINQEEWSGLLETLYLQSIPGMTESIIEARNAPASERLEDIGWDID